MRLGVLFYFLFASISIFGQSKVSCGWGETPADSVKALEAHVLYRGYLQKDNIDLALKFWKKAHQSAPCATAKHQRDGIKLYKKQLKIDPANQPTYVDSIFHLYEEQIEFYKPNGDVLARKANDMLRYKADRLETLKTYEAAIQLSGNKTKAYIIRPIGDLTLLLYKRQKIDKERVKSIFDSIEQIVIHNKDNKYKEAWDVFLTKVNNTRPAIFECDYYTNPFKKGYVYRSGTESYNQRKDVIKKLKACGCDSSNSFYQLLITHQQNWKREQRPLHLKCQEAYQNGNIEKAVSCFETAIIGEGDALKKSEWAYKLAYILYTEGNNMPKARQMALQAVSYNSSYGEPLLLIGMIYLKSVKSCGSNEKTRKLIYQLAINYFKKAKNFPSTTKQAKANIAKYSGYALKKVDIHMMWPDKKEGEMVNIGCWINKTIPLSTN